MKLPSLDKYQREGVISLWVLILIYVFGLRVFDYFYEPEVIDYTELLLQDSMFLAAMDDSLLNQRYNDDYNQKPKKATVSAKKFYFDPNTITKDSLSLLGLPPRIVNNIIKYREKGGRYRDLEHFSKTYGIEPFLDDLAQFVDIAQKPKRIYDSTSFQNKYSAKNQYDDDTLTSFKSKYPNVKAENAIPKSIKVNESNIYQLMEVKGIGNYIAQKIVDYRDRLGGFINLSQIEEIPSLTPEQIDLVKQNITLDIENVKKIKINDASEADLRRHPYLTYKQIQIIKLFQKNNGNLKNEADYKKIGIFSNEQIAMMRPYIEY